MELIKRAFCVPLDLCRAMYKDDHMAQDVLPAVIMLGHGKGLFGGARHAVFARSLAKGTQDDGEKGCNLLES